MGCFKSKSQIPVQQPGQILASTGVPEFDRVFTKCEGAMKTIDDSRTALDLLTTDFVRSLGAEKHWELNPDLKDLIKMMLVVLSASSRGDLDVLGLTYSSEAPYLHVSLHRVPKMARRIVRYYYDLIDGMDELQDKLSPLLPVVNKRAIKVKDYRERVTTRAEELGFTMQDKIAAVKNTNQSWKKITEAPKLLSDLLKVTQDAKQRIADACHQIQVPPHSDRLISRGVQAHAEGLKRAEDVVAKFWPIN